MNEKPKGKKLSGERTGFGQTLESIIMMHQRSNPKRRIFQVNIQRQDLFPVFFVR